MAKTARLDQILLQLGYVHMDEVARALRRQEAHGGRLGMNLVQLGAISEEQLLIALAEQFRMPTLKPSEADVPPELLLRMPEDVISAGLMVPLAWGTTRARSRSAKRPTFRSRPSTLPPIRCSWRACASWMRVGADEGSRRAARG